jgi:hypothetical protein
MARSLATNLEDDTMTMTRRIAGAIAGLLAGAALTACGNSSVPVSDTAADTAKSPAGDSAPARTPPLEPGRSPSKSASQPPSASPAVNAGEQESVVVDGRTITGLPEGLPFPSGAQVSNVITIPIGGTLDLIAADGTDLAEFYQVSLPKAGFTIETGYAGGPRGLVFSGKGWTGTVTASGAGGATLVWGLSAELDPGTFTTRGSSLMPYDVGVTYVDFLMKFPPGTQLTDLSDTPGGASYSFEAPGPAQVLAFYRELVDGVIHTLDSTTTTGGVTTMAWHTDDYDVVLTVDAETAAMASTKR